MVRGIHPSQTIATIVAVALLSFAIAGCSLDDASDSEAGNAEEVYSVDALTVEEVDMTGEGLTADGMVCLWRYQGFGEWCVQTW